MRFFIAGLAAALLLATSTPATAQYTTATGGVKVGQKSRLHFNLDLATVLDTNAFREESGDDIVESWRFVARPGVLLDVPGSDLSIQLGGNASISTFLNTPPAIAQSTSDGMVDDRVDVGGNANARIRVGSARSTVAFELENQFTRTPAVINSADAIAADEVSFPEFRNRADARVTLRPGGGALEFDVGYRNVISFFDDLTDSQQHQGLLESRWRFLPKTLVFVRGLFGVFTSAQGGNDAAPLSIEGGLIGQVTERIIIELSGGYGNALVYGNDDLFGNLAPGSQDSGIGRAFITYQFTPRANIQLGWNRSVRPIIIFDSVIEDDFTLRGTLGVGRVVGQAFVQGTLRNFGEDPLRPAGSDDPFARLITGGVGVDYFLLDYLVLGMQYRIIDQNSNDEAADMGESLFIGNFTRQQGIFTVSVRY
ncbi:MAG: hypothetical protein ACFB9M_01950 [Myxococcota bacterium]